MDQQRLFGDQDAPAAVEGTTIRCPKCGKMLPEIEFYAGPNLNGKQSYCRTCFRVRWYRYKYGLAWDDVVKMLDRQGGVCAICGTELHLDPAIRNTGTLCVDHDHATGKVRGILCRSCNTGLGWLENQQQVQRAYAYLAAHRR